MSGAERVLVDTNVLVYAYAKRDPKHRRAADVLHDLARDRRLVVSAQNLNELYVVLTRTHRGTAVPAQEAAGAVREVAAAAEVLPLTAELSLIALDGVASHAMSFWDALVWACAKQHGVTRIFTEDFTHDREVDGVRFVNPFLAVP